MMKKLLSMLFAAALVLAACGGSDDTDDAASIDADAAEPAAGEDTETEDPADEGSAAEDSTVDEDSDSDDASDVAPSGGDLSDDEAALAAALTAEDLSSGNVPFSDAEVQCVNEGVVQSIGVEALNGYGISVDTPDSSLLPDEYEIQAAAFAPLTDCLDVGTTFTALAPDCDLGLSSEQFDLAFEYDFLGSFAEYDNPAAADASAALEAAILACDSEG